MKHSRWLLSRRGALALLAGAALVSCGRKSPRARPVPKGAVVLALGDSLTFGTGATPDTAYPAELARLSGWDVVNAGVPGDTAAQARERLPVLLDTAGAQLVIVSIGGNDFLRRLPEADTRAHIEAICDAALARGLQVMLLAVPRPSLSAAIGSLTDHPMYADIAATRKARGSPISQFDAMIAAICTGRGLRQHRWAAGSDMAGTLST